MTRRRLIFWPPERTRGFTIIELMIATMIFSVVLLLVTSGILQVARVYYKGLTEANTQTTARGIIDNISQSIQFSGGPVSETVGTSPGTDYAFCINNNQFTYRLGRQVRNNPTASDQTWHAIVVRTITGSCSTTAAQVLSSQTVTGGRDLMGQDMRLANLVVDDIGSNRFRITVRVVYGDSELLFSPSAPGDTTGYGRADAVCRPERASTQFCAVSELSTVVVKRVQ